jgi:glycine/D-amino acid oxidase-like deaminating enzyme
VTPLRRQVARTVRTKALPWSMPMTIYCADGFHLRVRDGRVLLLWPSPGVPGRPFDDSVDPVWVEQVVRIAHERLPVLRDVPVDLKCCWAGTLRDVAGQARHPRRRARAARTSSSSTALPATA